MNLQVGLFRDLGGSGVHALGRRGLRVSGSCLPGFGFRVSCAFPGLIKLRTWSSGLEDGRLAFSALRAGRSRAGCVWYGRRRCLCQLGNAAIFTTFRLTHCTRPYRPGIGQQAKDLISAPILITSSSLLAATASTKAHEHMPSCLVSSYTVRNI